jgi:hypothetical protein
MLLMDALRAPKFSKKQIRNLSKLRTLVDSAVSSTMTQRPGFSLLTRVHTLGFDIPAGDCLGTSEQIANESGDLNASLSQGKPIDAMIADLRASERIIRHGLEPPQLPFGRLCPSTPSLGKRKSKFSLAKTGAVQRDVAEPERREPFDPEELKDLISAHLDTRIRPRDIDADAERRARRFYRRPYTNPRWSDWREGVLPDLAPRVMVIREFPFQQPEEGVPSPLFRPATVPMVCSSKIPPQLSVREMIQDYVSLRAFSPREKRLALSYEVYTNGQREVGQTRILITHSPLRSTVKEAVRLKDWLRAQGRQAGRPSSTRRPPKDSCSRYGMGCDQQGASRNPQRLVCLPSRQVERPKLKKGVCAVRSASRSRKVA